MAFVFFLFRMLFSSIWFIFNNSVNYSVCPLCVLRLFFRLSSLFLRYFCSYIIILSINSIVLSILVTLWHCSLYSVFFVFAVAYAVFFCLFPFFSEYRFLIAIIFANYNDNSGKLSLVISWSVICRRFFPPVRWFARRSCFVCRGRLFRRPKWTVFQLAGLSPGFMAHFISS